MSKLTDALNDVKDGKDVKTTKGMILKHRFDKMFINARDDLEEVRAGLHASSIIASDGEFCYRCQVLSLLYEQNQGKELPTNSLRIFAAGSSIHEKWQRLFERNSGKIRGFKLIKNEARSFDERYELYFTPDSEIELDCEAALVEYKSMNTFAFQKAGTSSNPHPSARKQLQLYMFLRGISKGYIFLEDKNTQDFMIVPVEFNYEEVLPFIDRLNEVHRMKKEAIESNYKIFPVKKCKNQNTKKAIECNMRDACFKCGKGRVKLPYVD